MAQTERQTLAVATPAGVCPVHLHTPAAAGCWPGVILYMDAPGMRPALHEIAARLAAHGYAVALPDLFYRAGAYDPIDPKLVFTNPVLRAAHRAAYVSTATPANVMADTRAILAAMASWPAVATGRHGAVGYCMGGRLALIAAGTYPDRFAAVASYHAGSLADDTPTSPHLLAPAITARVYIAGASEDANFPDAMKARLQAALTAAGTDHLVETYPARHGWVPSDTPAHDPAEAEHHWRTLLELFSATMRPGAA